MLFACANTTTDNTKTVNSRRERKIRTEYSTRTDSLPAAALHLDYKIL